jgi:hypothetical protein
MSRHESAQARYRKQLEALAGDGVVLDAVAEAAELWGWLERPAWRRLHERFEPGREPYATCVLASLGRPQRIVRVDAFRDRQPEPVPGTCVPRTGPAGQLRIGRVPPDPGLPTLPTVLEGGPRRTIVRYHPGRRCTIRSEEDGRTRFAKVYADAGVEQIYANGFGLWRVSSELEFLVAKPERYDAELRVVWQESVDGDPLASRLHGSSGEALARRLGSATGSLARSGLRPRRRRHHRTELVRSASRCADLERRVPQLAEPARRLLDKLEAAHRAFPSSEPRPVHGALHTSQWLEGACGFALLDYDSLALGDPELDAATFLADLDFQNRERVPVDRLNAAFLAGYESTAGALDTRRLSTYRTHRRLEKTVRVARSFRPDGDRKAARRLRRALESFERTA